VFTVGVMLTEAEEELLKTCEQRLKCIKSALSRIAYSDISRKNLYRKLRSKYPPKLCEETVELMVERGYINDERLCRDTVETLYRVRLYGKRKIAAKLYDAVFERLREAGCEAVRVGTGLDDAHAPARRAYEKAGFEASLSSIVYYKKI
jgi:SOS response regulatory protein OraA/RecX